MTKNTGRLAFAIALEVLVAMFFFGPRLLAAGQAESKPAQAPPKVNVSEYRNRPGPPNPANPPGPVHPLPYTNPPRPCLVILVFIGAGGS